MKSEYAKPSRTYRKYVSDPEPVFWHFCLLGIEAGRSIATERENCSVMKMLCISPENCRPSELKESGEQREEGWTPHRAGCDSNSWVTAGGLQLPRVPN